MSPRARFGHDLGGTPRDRAEKEHKSHVVDELAALDGELGHDIRERVLGHLATCDMCRAEWDEQRRLKSIFEAAEAALPSSDGLFVLLRERLLASLRELDDRSVEGVHQMAGQARCAPSPAELAAQALWVLDENAGTVFDRLDQLFRDLGPPPDDEQELDQIQQNGEGGQM